jgi:hypothetical protein
MLTKIDPDDGIVSLVLDENGTANEEFAGFEVQVDFVSRHLGWIAVLFL